MWGYQRTLSARRRLEPLRNGSDSGEREGRGQISATGRLDSRGIRLHMIHRNDALCMFSSTYSPNPISYTRSTGFLGLSRALSLVSADHISEFAICSIYKYNVPLMVVRKANRPSRTRRSHQRSSAKLFYLLQTECITASELRTQVTMEATLLWPQIDHQKLGASARLLQTIQRQEQ